MFPPVNRVRLPVGIGTPLLHPNMAQIYREWVLQSRAALAHEDTGADAAAALRKIIEDIVLAPGSDGRLGIVVKGELARLLAVTVPAGEAEEFRQRVSLVAGARGQSDMLEWVAA